LAVKGDHSETTPLHRHLTNHRPGFGHRVKALSRIEATHAIIAAHSINLAIALANTQSASAYVHVYATDPLARQRIIDVNCTNTRLSVEASDQVDALVVEYATGPAALDGHVQKFLPFL